VNGSPLPEGRRYMSAAHEAPLTGSAGWPFPDTRGSQRTWDLGPSAVLADRGIAASRRRKVARLVFVLYLATLSVDAIRKVAGGPSSLLIVIYVITALIYIVVAAESVGRKQAAPRAVPRTLPVWLFLLSLWCLAVAVAQHIPLEIALLGWMSYVFFVPLLYVGAELTADDHLTAKALRVVALSGAVVGAGAIASTVLGQSAPALLQPIIPEVGIHSFTGGNIYLSPSIFATAEEASEQLLIALFAWAAFTHLPSGISRRKPWLLLVALIVAGLIVVARRTDIYVAIAGMVAALILGRIGVRASAPRAPAPSAPPALSGRAPARTRRRLGTPVLLAAAGAVVLIFLLGDIKLASFLASGSPASRITAMFSVPNPGSVLGQGPGTSTQGLSVVDAASLTIGSTPGSSSGYILGGRTFITVEGGLAKVWLELGILGAALYGAVFWAALALPIRSLRRLDGVSIALTLLAIALGIVFLKGHQSLDDPLIQPLFWLSVGGIWGRMRAVPDPSRQMT
jgi:hypothetical protein